MLLRFLTMGALVLLLLVPLSLTRGVIEDRKDYREQAYARVASSWAGEQTLTGPVRVVPWTEQRTVETTDAAGVRHTDVKVSQGHWLQMPARLEVSGTLVPDERRIGLFRIPVYRWQGQVRAHFNADDYPVKAGRRYGTPYLALGISDVRGVVGSPSLRVDGRPLPLRPGVGRASTLGPGLHAPVTGLVDAQGGTLAASDVVLDLQVNGTRALSVVPAGDDNRISLEARWPHPSFSGAFLPNERSTDSTGFKAGWAVSSLASSAQRQLREGGETAQAVQVALINPVDAYTQADRASKYGVLFVLLTFTGFLLFELVRKLRIHPLQYLMVGLGLAVFFLLLISLSEHIAFWQAYLVAAVACIGLQAVYLAHVLKHWQRGLSFAAMLTVLYGALYGLLVSEENALLMGSLLLFSILAASMWVTRRVDWYALGGDGGPGNDPR